MAYCDYTYYTDTYIGNKLSAEQFSTAAERAADFIAYITLNKATSDYDAVKRCNCALAEVYADMEQARLNTPSGAFASETVGAYSVSYRSGADILQSYGAEAKSVCARYLAPTGLLYRGCGIVYPS